MAAKPDMDGYTCSSGYTRRALEFLSQDSMRGSKHTAAANEAYVEGQNAGYREAMRDVAEFLGHRRTALTGNDAVSTEMRRLLASCEAMLFKSGRAN
jgi:hypothetical protein